MQRYTIDVGGRTFTVDVRENERHHYSVAVDGEPLDVVVTSFEELGEPGAEDLGIVPTVPAPSVLATTSRLVSRIPSPTSPRAGGKDTGVLAAPMPGVVLRVMVAPGAKVVRGQELAVLEAMKMENVLHASRDGTVSEVCVAAGQQVGPGEAILRFSAAS